MTDSLNRVLTLALKYVKAAHDDAEAKHDSHGDFYMDSGLWETMQETEKLISDIEKLRNGSNS